MIEHWSRDTGTEAHLGKINLLAGKPYRFRVEYNQGDGNDNIHLSWLAPVPGRPAEVRVDAAGRRELVAAQPGHYSLTTAGGQVRRIEIDRVPAPQELAGAWDVRFPPKWGAPAQITLDHLDSLSYATNPGVKYFSGTATYTKTFDWRPASPARDQRLETWLDLGDVQVMAQVKLNGQELGTLWKAPFRVKLTGALQAGGNTLEIRVANLWPNRMIGDAALPVAERFTWSSYEPFTGDSALPKSGLIGPVMLQSQEIRALP